MKLNGAATIEDAWPLAPLQATMLVASLRDPASGVFVQQEVMQLPEPVDAEAFRHAWQALVQRTPALRASFHWQDLEQPVQLVHRDAPLLFDVHDWRRLGRAEHDARLAQLLADGRHRGFALDRAPLMRLALIRSPAGGTAFVWEFHHLLFDGWSAQMLVGEVVDHYRALTRHAAYDAPRRRSPRAYIDWLAGRDLGAARRHWQAVLRGYDEPVALGLPRPGGMARAAADEECATALDEAETQQLRTLAREHGLTLNALVQGAWALLLAYYADRDDVVFGAVVAGRPPEIDGIEQMIGLFINAVPVRARIDPQAALLPWLKDLQAEQARATPFHYLAGAELQRCSELPAGAPLFETLLVFENFPAAATGRGAAAPAGLDLARVDLPLTVLAIPGDRLQLKLRFDAARYRADDIAALGGHLVQLLLSMVDAPFARLIELTPLGEPERARLAAAQSAGPAVTELDVAALLRRWAIARPSAPVFVDDGGTLDYATLDAASDRLAQVLRRAGVQRGVPVAVCALRTFEQVIAFYAVLKAHGVYLPLDPGYPERRLEQMLEDAAPAVVLCGRGIARAGAAQRIDIAGALDGEAGDRHMQPVVWQPDDPAYIVFTSGSTGRPKGVLVPWGQVANRLAWMWKDYPFAAGECACQRTAINFVDSLWELLGAALQGIPTVIVPERTAVDAHALIARLAGAGVSRLWFVPSLLRMLLEARPDLGAALPALRFWVSSGEALAADLAARFAAAHPEATLYNLYGTSEVWDATWFDPRREPPVQGSVPIGRPIDGVSAAVLDRHGRSLPFEVAGELCIGGAAVALGYLGSAVPDGERGLPDRFTRVAGARVYRTGDLARVQRDGLIVCLGRRDHQLKLRGVRVEPAEIEAALRALPAVRQAVVLLRDERLLAYVVAPAAGFDAAALRRALHATLPEAMVPARIVRLDALPQTPNGKLDRAALPPPDAEAAFDTRAGATPSALEAEVLGCFKDVLDLPQAGVDAHFFRDLGGHSLLALRVSSRLARRFGIEVPAAIVFKHPSARELARWLAAEGAGADAEDGDAELLALLQQLPPAERERLLAGDAGGRGAAA